MLSSDEIKDTVVNNVLCTYEDKMENIEEMFQISLPDTRQEGEKINNKLRDILAKNSSLRKKDFDHMMLEISSIQEMEEGEIKGLLRVYFNEQREIVKDLRGNLKIFKESLIKGEARRIQEFQVMIRNILDKQEKRKNEVTSKLKEFQKEQQEMMFSLNSLLARGKDLRVNDLRLLLNGFRAQHKERVVCHEKRKEDIKDLLGGFKKERAEASGNWQSTQ